MPNMMMDIFYDSDRQGMSNSFLYTVGIVHIFLCCLPLKGSISRNMFSRHNKKVDYKEYNNDYI